MPFTVTKLSSFRNERLIFRNINFSLSEGEAIIIQGPNGVGKSTLLRILAGFKKPDTGVIYWKKENVFQNYSEYLQNIAWLGHNDALKSSLTLKENLLLYAKLYKTDLTEALTKLNLLHYINTPVRLLSAGQKRRAALARILLKPAKLWFLDEPTVGLDHKTIIKLADIFMAFQKQGGIILASTHVPLPLAQPQILQLSPPTFF